ncbi:MAG: hypothetical protein OEY63_07965, partial [Gemmatimonadota bacterium]|nr:hypothetical protein [Gemmatimonadota bacterium]
PPVVQGAGDRLQDIVSEWTGHRASFQQILQNLDAFNQLLNELGVPQIVVEEREQIRAISMRTR